MATQKHTQEVNDAELSALYEGVMSCQPFVPPGEMEDIANLVFSKERVIRNWRLAALIGSKDGEFFRELASDANKAQSLAPAVRPLMDAAMLLHSMAEIMTIVSDRIMVAGCNHDRFNEWMEAGVEAA